MLNNTTFIVFVFVFIYLLAAFRKHLIFEIQALSLLLFGSHKPGLVMYTIMMLPGTIIHELSHWIMAEILRVPTGEITILPDYEALDKQEKRLGSVATAKTDPLRGFLIGMAPLITGTALLVILSILLEQSWITKAPTLQIAILVYGVVVLGNSMLTSKSDRRYWPFMAFITILAYCSIFKAGISLSKELNNFLTETLRSINNALLLTLFIEFALIDILFLFRKATEKLKRKKIIKN